ncbi:MAG: polysaccharide pyruvyl transferase CsaB [bacterium]
MSLNNKKILISGYYGFNNFGDDAILHVIIEDIKKNIPEADITVLSATPQRTEAVYGVKAVNRFDLKKVFSAIKYTDVFVSGGGSLLQDITSFKSLVYYLGLIFTAKMLTKKVFIYAQGIGPIDSKIGRVLTHFVLKRADVVTVRDNDSKNFLDYLDVNADVTADPVWKALNPDSFDFEKFGIKQDKIKVGVQLRNWKTLDDKATELLAKAVNKTFGDMSYQIVLLSLQDSQDLAVSKLFESKLKVLNPVIDTKIVSNLSVLDGLAVISQMDFMAAVRFHAALCAMKFNIPTFCISYDPKVSTLAEEAGAPWASINKLNLEEIEAKLEDLSINKSLHEERLRLFSNKKQQLANKNVDFLMNMLK